MIRRTVTYHKTHTFSNTTLLWGSHICLTSVMKHSQKNWRHRIPLQSYHLCRGSTCVTPPSYRRAWVRDGDLTAAKIYTALPPFRSSIKPQRLRQKAGGNLFPWKVSHLPDCKMSEDQKTTKNIIPVNFELFTTVQLGIPFLWYVTLRQWVVGSRRAMFLKLWSADHKWSSGSALVVLLDWTLVQKRQKK
jgi:hypothetical protein